MRFLRVSVDTDLYYAIAILLSILLASYIALKTKAYFHPDELLHVDAMCYFESHWWPPPLDDDGLRYSRDGWSRVYNGEFVYLVYGTIGNLLKPISTAIFPPPSTLSESQSYSALHSYALLLPVIFGSQNCTLLFQPYRLLNVLLCLGTMLLLYRFRHASVPVAILGQVFLCIPQVLYLYSYANSDAWGLSASLLLFVFLLTTKLPLVSYRYAAFLGLCVGILLLSKTNFWLSLSWAMVIIFAQYVMSERTPSLTQLARVFVVFAAALLFTVAPLKIIYPLTQGEWSAQTDLMRERRSKPDYKPSQPANQEYMLASKGESIAVVIANPVWFERTLKSFYGYFGAMSIPLPDWIYYTGLGIGMLNISVTIFTASRKWLRLPLSSRWLILSAPLIILLCFLASLYNSWTYDFQPQGRYLFASLPSFAMLLAGTISVEQGYTKRFRVISWAAAYTLCIYALVTEIFV